MNETVDSFSRPAICEICQTSHGFSSADRRSIIVLVVLTSIALILCYVGVLWYAIRARFIPEDKSSIVMENVYKNEAFEDQDEETENNPSMTQPAVFAVEIEREKY